MIAENSHVRLASAANNDGAQILRRPYSYNDGANVNVMERHGRGVRRWSLTPVFSS